MTDSTGAPDDLTRILTYADAVDGRGGVDEVGAELLVVPFWTPAFCAAVVRAAELVGFAPDPDDPVPGHEVSLAAISPRLFQAVQDDLGRRIWPQLQTVWPLIDYHGLRDAFVIRYAPGEQEELRTHHDVAQVSASVKLDDDYEGAELRFPRQGVDNSAVAVGSLLAWPSLVTHPHDALPLRRGVKHSLTIWFELPLSGLEV
ncbi:MAG: 2OG-Fe(II) oxygenase [Desertimonas sp.]